MRHLSLIARGLAGAFLILALTRSTVSADGGPLSIGGRAAYYSPRDGTANWYGGAQARLRLPLFFGVEGSVDYRRTSDGDLTVHTWPVQVSALLYFPKIIWLQPFLLGGVGWYHNTVDEPDGAHDTSTQFGPHVGAGAEFNLNSYWFIDATYRYIWLNKISTDSNSINDSGHLVTVGLNYRI